jgi:ribosomal protein L17
MAGRPIGSKSQKDRRLTEKPFADALRMEIAGAEGDYKRLRAIARALITKAEDGDLQAIEQVANRLDGRPAQESTVTIDDKRDAFDWTREELQRRLAESIASNDDAGDVAANGRRSPSDPVH